MLEAVPLRAEAPLLVMALIEARFQPGTHETYQVPLGLRPPSEGWTERVIVETDGWTVYDALADPALGRALLHAMRSGDEVAVEDGTLSFHWARVGGRRARRHRRRAARSASSSPTPRSCSATS